MAGPDKPADRDAAGRADLLFRHRKNRDRSLILLVVGIILLMPPVVGIFLLDGRFAGVPLTLLYVLTIWALLILGTRVLSTRLEESDEAAARDGET